MGRTFENFVDRADDKVNAKIGHKSVSFLTGLLRRIVIAAASPPYLPDFIGDRVRPIVLRVWTVIEADLADKIFQATFTSMDMQQYRKDRLLGWPDFPPVFPNPFKYVMVRYMYAHMPADANIFKKMVRTAAGSNRARR